MKDYMHFTDEEFPWKFSLSSGCPEGTWLHDIKAQMFLKLSLRKQSSVPLEMRISV